ncbi:hypothetical protein [Microbulbifer sp. JMSA003]|uniref:hypothetical protein n=1 Tax=unclassified Microbulbifer TaxID=2619833 RepID=UPI00403960B4
MPEPNLNIRRTSSLSSLPTIVSTAPREGRSQNGESAFAELRNESSEAFTKSSPSMTGEASTAKTPNEITASKPAQERKLMETLSEKAYQLTKSLEYFEDYQKMLADSPNFSPKHSQTSTPASQFLLKIELEIKEIKKKSKGIQEADPEFKSLSEKLKELDKKILELTMFVCVKGL